MLDTGGLGGNVATARDTITAVLSVEEAATRLGLKPAWVRRLAAAGRIKANKVGRDWVIQQSDLDRFAKIPRDVGPPTKAERRKRARAQLASKS